MVMMYISIFPVAISIRQTNVYEEMSLGIYAPENEENRSFLGMSPRIEMRLTVLATHIRRQLGFDLWYIFLGLFIICIVESDQIQDTNNYVKLHLVFMLTFLVVQYIQYPIRSGERIWMRWVIYRISSCISILIAGVSKCQRRVFLSVPCSE
jgi:hypothetical protein